MNKYIMGNKIETGEMMKKYHLGIRGDNPSSETRFTYAFLRPAEQYHLLYPWRQGMP